MAHSNTAARSTYVVGLQNAHALENEAIQIMSRQVERLENYPEMETRLRQHIDETRAQKQRLDEILDAHGEDNSSIKDAIQSMMGNMAALGHSLAGDEILKNSFANYAFESFEIASYKSLITMADHVGDRAAMAGLEQTLREEVAMQEWLATQIEPTTLKFLALEERNMSAKV